MNLIDKKIIRIEPTNPTFTVNWNIGLRCNFDCMYCPEMYHNITDKDLTLAEFQTHWQKIVEKTQHTKLKYKLTFTGGEVTINKNFLPFLIWLDKNYKEQISECGFTTNGSASKRYYLDAINISIISFISFSTHSEFFNEKKFFDTVVDVNEKSLSLKKSIHINIMDEFWNEGKSKIYSDFLTERKINNSINVIYYTHKIRDTVRFNPNRKEFNFNG
jgi:MoaA/NifB/PqqE/SkfB family radical SAM enzyme